MSFVVQMEYFEGLCGLHLRGRAPEEHPPAAKRRMGCTYEVQAVWID